MADRTCGRWFGSDPGWVPLLSPLRAGPCRARSLTGEPWAVLHDAHPPAVLHSFPPTPGLVFVPGLLHRVEAASTLAGLGFLSFF